MPDRLRQVISETYNSNSFLLYKKNHKRKDRQCQERKTGNLYRNKQGKRIKLSELSKLQKI